MSAGTTTLETAVGAAVGYGGLWLVGKLGTLLFRKDAMGVGDMKLMAMFGAFLGPEPLLHVLILACLVGTAAGLAGLLAALRDPQARAALKLDGNSRVFLVNTEGATDPARYAELVGLKPEDVA